jgi:alkylation response protein AidB-like acyl-CoA dehydrogenase
MADKFFSERNLKFLLYEVLDTTGLTQYEGFRKHNRQVFDMIIDACIRLAKDLFKPCLEEMDRESPELANGQVKVHPWVKKIMKESGDGGWIGLRFAEAYGGEQLPAVIGNTCEFIFTAANYSAAVYPHLTAGAAHLIMSFASPGLIDTYVENMLSGKWQGTMALTEPQAGSSLSDITTTAWPTEEGYYRIKGQKIFISAGDHDGVENVVHLMLAKIDGAPVGVKGISLFVVPKLRYDESQKLVSNDITVSQIYHKLGYRGAPITELVIGENNDCRGYLVGEPHKGLKYMFQMMNEARISVGIGAAGIASAAYYAALEYAKARPQGRQITAKDPTLPQIPIIEHADVKRMLLFQRAIVEGSISILLQCSLLNDLFQVSEGDEKEKAYLLLEILTPIAKTYPSEMGVLSTSQSLQCFGGYGYCEDFPVEQYYRDARIHPIHEGTTGIQGMDLLGRKVIMQNGKAFQVYTGEIRNTIQKAVDTPELSQEATRLEEAVQKLEAVTLHLISVAQSKGPEAFLADATLYLEFFGIIAVAWQWLKQAITAHHALQSSATKREVQFYQGKIFTFKYFFEYELPKIEGLSKRLMSANLPTVDMKTEFFND